MGSQTAITELQNNAFLPIEDDKINNENKIFLLSICAALVLGFSGKEDKIFLENSAWKEKFKSNIGIFDHISVSFAGKVLGDADTHIDWILKRDAKTVLNFFYQCASRKMITPEIYAHIIHKLLKNKKDLNFENNANYDLYRISLLKNPVNPHEVDHYLNKILPEFISAKIMDVNELPKIKKIFQSITNEEIRKKLEKIFFERSTVGIIQTHQTKNLQEMLSKKNVISPIEQSVVYYKTGCEAMENGDYISAKACFMLAVELGLVYPENFCDAYYRLGIIHQKSGNLTEAMACFTKSMLLNAKMSDQIIKDFLNYSLIPDEILPICAVITMAFLGKNFSDECFKQSNDWLDNKYRNIISINPLFICETPLLIIRNNLEIALQFFNYCVSHKIISPNVYENILLALTIPSEQSNLSDEYDEVNYVLFKAFLLSNSEKAEFYLKKISPLFLYGQLSNPDEFSDLQKIPVPFKCQIFEKLSSFEEAFEDPKYW